MSENGFENLLLLFVFRLLVAMLFLGLVVFLFLFFGLALYFCECIAILGVEVFMVKVALLAVFTDFVKIIHVELNCGKRTCRTKDE